MVLNFNGTYLALLKVSLLLLLVTEGISSTKVEEGELSFLFIKYEINLITLVEAEA